MAITRIQKQSHRTESSRDVEKRTAREYWIVVADSAITTAEAETASLGGVSIPTPGVTTFDGDSVRKCTRVTARHAGDTLKACEVEVEYETREVANQWQENPLLREPDIEWGADESTEPYFRDTEGNPVVNSAGEPFENFLEREAGDYQVTITRNEETINPNLWVQYRHATNSDSFTIDGVTIGVGEAKLGIITASRQRENGVLFWRVTYPIKLRESWIHEVEDRGYNEIDPGSGGGGLKPILDATGKPVDKPWPLDGNGAAKANPTDAPVVGEFYPYREKPFSVFNFS